MDKEEQDSMAMRAADAAIAEAKSMGAEHVIVTVFADGRYQTRWAGAPIVIRGLAEIAIDGVRNEFFRGPENKKPDAP